MSWGSAASLLPAQLAWLATQAVPHIPARRAAALRRQPLTMRPPVSLYEAAGRHFQEAAALTDEADERPG